MEPRNHMHVVHAILLGALSSVTRRSAIGATLAATHSHMIAPSFAKTGSAELQKRMEARRRAEEQLTDPTFALPEAIRSLDLAIEKLKEERGSVEKWSELRGLLTQPASSVRSTAKSELRTDVLSAINDVDTFAYLQQKKVWQEKYPLGYAQFEARNEGLDIAEPVVALERARSSLRLIVAQYRSPG